ncbi:MAG TPA: site-specific integrase [Rhodanobacter sp.]|nr:site-specific integrase [Rhodanobacter sp.]
MVALRTGDYREAQHLCKLLDRIFLRYASMHPPHDLHAILRRELVLAIENDRQRHIATPYGMPVYAHDVDDGVDPTAADLQQIDADIYGARQSLARRDTAGIEEWVDGVMSKHGLAPELRAELALGLAMVRVQRLERSRQHVISGVTAEIQPVALAPPGLSVAPQGMPTGPKLSEVLPAFIEQMTKESGWRGQTLMQNKGTYRILMEVCGDLPVTAYRRSELAKTLDLFRGLPADYAKAKRWKGLPLAELVAKTKPEEPRLAVKTLKRHFAALGSLFKHLIERGEYEGANPAHGFSFPEKMRAKMKRQMWDGERLRKLFASPVWTGCKTPRQRSTPGSLIIKDEKYWLPLLGLYHGNRLEEFAQLIGSDVRLDDDIWFLDINDDESKQIKNEQSKRRVPIHPTLLALGFLDYVQSIAPTPSDQLFPKLTPGGADGKRGHSFSKWWTRYRREIGVYEAGLDYHSFRHGVTTKLFAAEVAEVFVDELTGHEGKGTSRAVYTKEMPLRKLFDAICRVEWPEVTVAILP